MATRRLRLLSILVMATLVMGACSNKPAGSAASAGASGSASAACAGTGAQGGASLQIPDVEAGKFNVAMVLIGPHDDGGWSQAHYEGLQYLCQNMPDSHVAYIELVPEGSEVHVGLSETMREIGVTKVIEQSAKYRAIRPQLLKLDRITQRREMAKLATAPDYMLGSVHAVTEDGHLVIGSGTGSQLAAYANGAGKLILVAGA